MLAFPFYSSSATNGYMGQDSPSPQKFRTVKEWWTHITEHSDIELERGEKIFLDQKKKKSQQKSIKHLEISITRNVQDPCKHNNKANKQKQ